jgi:hypothetical protein
MGLLSLLSKRFGKKEARGLLSAAEEMVALRYMPPTLGPNGMKIAERRPFRNSWRGANDDLYDAARLRGWPDF